MPPEHAWSVNMKIDDFSLDPLIEFISNNYRFDGGSYPELRENPEKTFMFGVSHTAHHMMKSTATVATEAEKADHGGKIDTAALEIAVVKQLVNTLKLASHIGFTSSDLVASIHGIYQKL